MGAFAWVWVASSCLAATSAEVVIRDPDGKPVANRTVRFVEVKLTPFNPREPANEQEITTDAEGRARISIAEGLRRLDVRVAGVGFGGTGTFEATEGRVARPDLPRLARFARVEGKVAPQLFRPGMRVECKYSVFSENDPDRQSAACDPEGRFVFAEVIAGEPHLELFEDERRIPLDRLVLLTEPGQTRRDVVLSPPIPDPSQERDHKQTLDRLNRNRSDEEVAWVEGTVRDTRGTPIDNAEVMVKAVYHPGHRNYSELRTTHTDARGRYQIRGPHLNFQDAFTVVLRVPGCAPVLAYARAPGRDDAGPRGPFDLTVPDRGGSLDVRVLKDGKPASNVPVALHEQGFVERVWSRSTGQQRDIREPFHPIERTDNQGVAHFTNLYPCRYQLRTSEDGSALYDEPFPGGGGGARALIPALDIAAGEELAITVALHKDPAPVTFQAMRPDGEPAGQAKISFFFGLREPGTFTTMQFGDNGTCSYRFGDAGLWAVALHFRETDSAGLPWNLEPYSRGSTLVPVSPAVALESPVQITCDRFDPGSIRAQLLGLDGKPARGTILLKSTSGPDFGEIDRASSTDEQGVALFPDVPSGTYRIRGSMESIPPPYLALGNGPLPDDATLRNQVVFPSEEVKVEARAETRTRLQPVRAGYVRGRIRPAPGELASDYFPYATNDWLRLQPYSRREAATGEYLCGPLLPGPVAIRLHRAIAGKPAEDVIRTVAVASGEVTHSDLGATDDPPPSAQPGQSVSLGMGGISTMNLPPDAIGGTVVESDGKTPAFGAHAVLMVPREDHPTASAISDASGRLTWTGLWILRGPSSAPPDPKGQVTTPTVLVSLPGRAGAAVIPIDPANPKTFRAVLPPPLGASGRVTFGGRPIGPENARVRVIAGHRGRGVLDRPLSVEATVDPDGRFTLRGLTPGTYMVQAARDGIWLSHSATLEIAPDRKPADLGLDIPDPGAAVTLALVDADGRPAGRRGLRILRPEGPLMPLWPDAWTTNADGTLVVRGLEVGAHQMVIDGDDAPRAFEAPRPGGPPPRRVFTLKSNSR